MGLTSKEIRKVQKMAEDVSKKLQAINDFIGTCASEKELQSYTVIAFATNNIFEIQDALGGEITYSDWYKDLFCIGTLRVNGVAYAQYGLTKEKIDGRQSSVDYTS